MSAFINYFVESSLVLISFLILHRFFLAKETSFSIVRFTMLAGLVASIVFPLIKIQSPESLKVVPSLSDALPVHWLPDVSITASKGESAGLFTGFTMNDLLSVIYFTGVTISFIVFLKQLLFLRQASLKGEKHRVGKYSMIFTEKTNYSFSFFHQLFITRKEVLSESDRQQVIAHEMAHATALHSIDLLLLSLIQIIFWFNPIIIVYRRTLVQIHEFDADARAVKNHDVNQYCNLLARVALQSAGLSLASHFNNSLTVKRIQMMRTLKSKIKFWKLTACAFVLPLLFFTIACQDQVPETSSAVPHEAQSRFDIFQQAHPGENYILEKDDQLDANLASLQDKYGTPVFTEEFSVSDASGVRTFVMLQYVVSSNEPVFTVVEEMPEYPGGRDALIEMLQTHMRYPQSARLQEIEGKVFVGFIVEKNGAVSNVHVLKGLSAECDEESVRVVKMFPKWKPGTQNGKPVRVKFVLPINFSM